MSSPVVVATLSFLPAAVGDSAILGPDTTAGIKQIEPNLLNLPAGAVLSISTQKIHTSGGAYVETAASRVYSNPLAVPAEPSEGYAPVDPTDPEMSSYGYQAVVTFVSGTLPTTAIKINLLSV